MIEFQRRKRNRSKNGLFNPYENGISSYDMTYLSSRKSGLKNKKFQSHDNSKKDLFAA